MNLFKKATATLALVTLLSGVFSTGVSAYSSAEVEAANYLATAGIIVDHKDNPAAYNLDQNVLRQEIAAVARGIAGLEKKTTCAGVFKDVSATRPNDWACYTIEQLADNGLIALNENFRPEDNISKAEAIGMVVKAAFGDAYMYDASKTTTWQQQVVAFAVSNGVTSNFVNYDTPATRGFVFSAGANAMEVMPNPNDDEDLNKIMCELLGIGCETEEPGTTGTGSEQPPVVITGGGVEVTLNPKSPAAQTIPQTGLIPFGKFDFTAGREDVTINQIVLQREGLSNRSDIRRVYFEKNGIRVSNRTNVTMDDTALVTFTPALTIKAGTTETLELIVELRENISSTQQATVGAEHRFAILSNDDVDASVSVGGTFPVRTALMRIGSYEVSEISVTPVNTTSTFNVGAENALLGEFRLANDGEKDTAVKSVTFRNNGTADAGSSLSNIGLYKDGKKVSTEIAIVGRDVTVYASDEIVNGKSNSYELRADITGAERNNETYNFQIRNTSDLTVVEVASGFSAPIKIPPTPSDANNMTGAEIQWGRITVEGGDFLISRDTAYNLTQTVSASTTDVVLWAAKINVGSDINVEDLKLPMTVTAGANSGNLFKDFNQIKILVGDATVATYTPQSGDTGASLSLAIDANFTIRAGASTMKILGNTTNAASTDAVYKVGDLEFVNAWYASNDEKATPAGGAAGITTTIKSGALNLVRNDGIDNDTLVAGTNDKLVLGFTLRADDVSNVRISSVRPTSIGTDLTNYVSNYRLYYNNQLVKTSNNLDFSGLDITINKNQSGEFKILADFSNSTPQTSTYQLVVNSGSINARNLDSSKTVYATGEARSLAFRFSEGGAAMVTRNSSQAVSTLLTPSTSETSVFKFDVEADDDNIIITDVYVTNVFAATGSGYQEVLPTANGMKAAAVAAANAVTGTSTGDVLTAATNAITASGGDVAFAAAVTTAVTGTVDVAAAKDAVNNVPVNSTTFTMLANTVNNVPKANLIEAIRSSSLYIDGKTFSGDMLDKDTIHFGLGTNFIVKRDQVITGDVRVAFYDSSTRTNQGIELAINTGIPTNAVSGTQNGMRILSESTGNYITRDQANPQQIKGNAHRLVRSKPTITMANFSHSSTDMYRFTVTADSNRKITLKNLVIGVSGTADIAGLNIAVYRDSNGGAANLVGQGTAATSGITIDMTTGQASSEIAAGSTVTFYVQSTGTPSTANGTDTDKRRETQITGLTFFDDATPQTEINAATFNVGLPTSIDSYTY